jgi:hypothetical protein
VLKDYLKEQGFAGIIGLKNATREAFKNELIDDGQIWMDMIKARNLIFDTYLEQVADAIVKDILPRFFPAFIDMAGHFIQP